MDNLREDLDRLQKQVDRQYVVIRALLDLLADSLVIKYQAQDKLENLLEYGPEPDDQRR